jgi:hypothetical protein
MRRDFSFASIVLVVAVSSGCSSSSGSPDQSGSDSSTSDTLVAFDSGAGSDASDTATTTDSGAASDTSDGGADADETAVSCAPDFGVYSLGGAPGTTSLLTIGDIGHADGIVASVTEGGADIELSDIEAATPGGLTNVIAVGGGAIHSIAYAASGPYTATRLGDAPGITALARDGSVHFAAGGFAFSTITTSPFVVTPIGTLTPPTGCTKVVDFYATDTTTTGGLFIVALDCGTNSRIKEYTWSSTSSTLTENTFFDITGPAGPVGVSLNLLTTADGKLYQTSAVGSGSITFLRNLKPCVGHPTRGMQQ